MCHWDCREHKDYGQPACAPSLPALALCILSKQCSLALEQTGHRIYLCGGLTPVIRLMQVLLVVSYVCSMPEEGVRYCRAANARRVWLACGDVNLPPAMSTVKTTGVSHIDWPASNDSRPRQTTSSSNSAPGGLAIGDLKRCILPYVSGRPGKAHCH